MINEKELEIANISYTNKDFGAVYTEILDIARKMSDLWAPQSSNESDPGVVLLKLLAFAADKLNYNTDKNILEVFMPSATQESSMRKLCDMMGYYMNYYTSASTYITFTYKGTALDRAEGENIKYITLPKFSTVVSNDDNSIQYVLWEDVSMDSTSRHDTCLAKEGYLNVLNVGDSDKITLENLDSQRRIYLGESQIAQNGILIRGYNAVDSNATFWTMVENLNVQDPGAKCFKFGYDSKEKLPYIEFPQDIASLIGEGLFIRYLVTSGYYGNVGVGNLSKLLSPTSVEVTGGTESTTISFTDEEGNSSLNIKNNSAATNGKHPEDIDSAYNNFKKTVGTFQTLVTCRDYANYIYTDLFTSSGNHLVSNVQVGDRRTDLNHSKTIITYGDTGQYTKNTSTDYTKLFIYALKGINNPSNQSEYKESFYLIDNVNDITEDLNRDDSAATISYDYSFPGTDDIALIKILYTLDAKITTTYKVNVAEQLDIKKNIVEALRQKFYSRNIDYGYEIPYETINRCIMDADERIKSVILKEPDLSTAYMRNDNTVIPMQGTAAGVGGVPYADSPYLKVLAKNVLAGKVPLFEYDDRFNYEFGMNEYKPNGTLVGPILSNVEKFTSNSNIEFDVTSGEGSASVTVGENEVIQLIGPKLADETEFSTYVNYCFKSGEAGHSKVIPANTDTRLQVNDFLLLVYTDSAQNQIEVLYKEGDIIKSTFDIEESKFNDTSITKITKTLQSTDIIDAWGSSTVGCLGIPTNESIYKRAIVRHTFDSTIKAAWLVSDVVEENRIDTKFELVSSSGGSYVYEYILGDTEYFIYSIDGESSYEIFGSGTSLRLESSDELEISNIFSGTCNIPDLNDLYEYGLESISSILKSVSFGADTRFIVQANEILTLANGDVVTVSGADDLYLNNDWQSFADYTLEYKFLDSSTTESLHPYSLDGGLYNDWRIRSRLDLVAGPNKTQKLLPHQTITFDIGHNSYTIEGEESGRLRTNIDVDISGGTNVPLNIVDPTSAVVEDDGPIYPLSVLVFTDPDNKSENFIRSSGYYVKALTTAEMADFASGYSILQPTDLANGETLLMCYVTFFNAKFGTVNFRGENASQQAVTLTNYGDGSTVSSITYSSGDAFSKLLIIKIPSTCKKLKIYLTGTVTDSIGQIIIGTLDSVNGFNSRFNLSGLETKYQITSGNLSTALKAIIHTIDDTNIFYYTCELDSSEEIDEEDLSLPYALFDANNLAGRFSLAYVDVDGSSIEIARSSRL